jgi:hypothetical protein
MLSAVARTAVFPEGITNIDDVSYVSLAKVISEHDCQMVKAEKMSVTFWFAVEYEIPFPPLISVCMSNTIEVGFRFL